LKERAETDALQGMSWGTKWAREEVERARCAVVDAEQRLAKAQEAIAKANAGVLRAERHLRSAKRKLKLAGQRAAALEAEKAAMSVRARAMAERVIEGRTLKQIGGRVGDQQRPRSSDRGWDGRAGRRVAGRLRPQHQELRQAACGGPLNEREFRDWAQFREAVEIARVRGAANRV
jgi:chromosome segregation ATPase